MSDWPSVGVVIATHRQSRTLRRAIAAVRDQEYPGRVGVVVVYDHAEPDFSLSREDHRPVWVIANTRAPGTAGARNSGIAVLDTELVAFCEDTDVWLPGKLTAQVSAMNPDSEMVTCGTNVHHDHRRASGIADPGRIRQPDLLSWRMPTPHSSTFLLRRRAMLNGLGLVSEDATGWRNHDWDLLLRAARRTPITHIDAPYTNIYEAEQHLPSCFDNRISSLHWILRRHPELHDNRATAARVYGQLSCWHAATGDRATALRWARQACRAKWKEPRAPRGRCRTGPGQSSHSDESIAATRTRHLTAAPGISSGPLGIKLAPSKLGARCSGRRRLGPGLTSARTPRVTGQRLQLYANGAWTARIPPG